MLRVISKVFLQLVIIAAIILLFSGHFHLQARHEQLRSEFNGHWHYSPVVIPDFTFGKARIFEDESIPYHLTTKPKQPSPQCWNYVYSYCWR